MANEPVPPTPTAELATMMRTRADDLNDFVNDFAERGISTATIDKIAAARDLVYEAYTAISNEGWD